MGDIAFIYLTPISKFLRSYQSKRKQACHLDEYAIDKIVQLCPSKVYTTDFFLVAVPYLYLSIDTTCNHIVGAKYFLVNYTTNFSSMLTF